MFIVESNEQVGQIEALNYHAMVGDASDKAVLLDAGIKKAKVLIAAMARDADNILVMMTACNALPDGHKRPLKMICRIDQQQNIAKAKQVGADEVISPAVMAGDLIASSTVNALG